MRRPDPAPGARTHRVRVAPAPVALAALAVLAVLAALAALPLPATALQVLDARDGVAIEAVLSIREPTRIRIEGAPIADVFGNIHTSGCGAGGMPAGGGGAPVPAPVAPAANPAGEFVLECDRDKGEIYIRPMDDSPKPVNLFVSSAQATYTLVLRKADTPADTILIRDRSLRSGLAPDAAGLGAAGPSGPLGPAPSPIRAMKAMLVAMASGRAPPDVRVDELNQPVRLWAEARLLLRRRHDGRGLVGEEYLLHNVGPAPMVLAEQEFDRPDSPSGGQVLGVAVENHNLRPGESTRVFVIRRGGQ